MNILNELKGVVSSLEELEFKEVNSEQIAAINENYNCYISDLQYSENEWGDVIFICSTGSFKKMQYYMGLEYEDEYIEYELYFGNMIVVSYSGSDRASEVLEVLRKHED